MSLSLEGKPLILYSTNPAEYSEHWSNDFIKGLKTDKTIAFYDFSSDIKKKISDESSWCDANPFVKEYIKTKNPLYKGVYNFYKTESKKAFESRDNELVFRRFLLGQRVSSQAYKLCDTANIQVASDEIYQDKELSVALGIDLSFKMDFTAFSFVFYNDSLETIFVKSFLFLANTKERASSLKAMFNTWDKDGHIHIFNKAEINRDETIGVIKDFIKDKNIKLSGIVADPALSKQWRLDESFKNIEYVVCSPRNLTGSIRYLEKTILAKKFFTIGKNPALNWMLDCSLVSLKHQGYCSIYKVSERSQNIDGPESIVLGIKHLTEKRKKKHISFVV